jgi:Secretion system C-terminal sorting domain
MAMITRLLFRVALVIALAVTAGAYSAQAQYNMSLRFDTVTANPGDTVDLNVYYKFTSGTPTQSVQDFDVRYEYDTTEIYAFDYILDGTASANMSILDTSHHGILAANGSLDFTDSILFKIRFRVNKRLADTAFIQWDSDVSVFEYSDNINVTEQNGWIRTPSTAGSVTLSTSSMTVDTGKAFNVPVSISGIENAGVDSAVLQFEVDSTRLLFKGAFAVATSNATVQSIAVTQSVDTSHLDTVSIVLKAISGEQIAGSDSLVTLSFYSIAWYDTACITLRNPRFVALNSGSVIGNTVSSSGTICIVPGSGPQAGVNQAPVKLAKLVAYPNPASNQVTFDAGEGINMGRVTIEVYDALGRRVFETNDAYPVWQVPSDTQPGTYFVAMETETGRFTTCLVIEP